jgi:hypothetical protein
MLLRTKYGRNLPGILVTFGIAPKVTKNARQI